jgi:hypothetical protein
MSGFAGCCARAASGHAAAVLPTSAMNSRRLMALLALRTPSGGKQNSGRAQVRFTPEADIETQPRNVRFVPKADIRYFRSAGMRWPKTSQPRGFHLG